MGVESKRMELNSRVLFKPRVKEKRVEEWKEKRRNGRVKKKKHKEENHTEHAKQLSQQGTYNETKRVISGRGR